MEEIATPGTNILRCRYYENRFPENEDVVVVNVRSIAEMGAYVHLLEYNGIEGMILLSELSRRRIRSINKLLRVGRNEVVVVIRVDKDKGYIDLSKRRVSADDVIKCEEKFSRAKAVNQILTRVAGVLNYEKDEQLEELYHKTAWHFDRKMGRPAASFDAFKQAVNNADILEECELDPKTKEVLLSNIRQRLLPQTVKIRADLEVSCFNYEGIYAIKRALAKGLEYSSEELPIKINLIAPPLFVMTVQTLKRQDGLDKLHEALEAIERSINEQGGTYKLVKPPRVVSDVDEAELKRQLAEAEEENREVSGDSESESDEDDDDGDGDRRHNGTN